VQALETGDGRRSQRRAVTGHRAAASGARRKPIDRRLQALINPMAMQ
jgi:hypothetical protein